MNVFTDESAQALLAFKNGGIKFDHEPEIKMETEDVLGPLGLLRVGTELPPRSPQPGLILNRRGMVSERTGIIFV